MSDADSPSFFEERFHQAELPRASDIRKAYERDRARIIHSSAFRRLQGKTQVMGAGEGDFHRTRLTHSIECGQIGTGLLDQLREDDRIPHALKVWFPTHALMEAACFAHDIGHPPFGHGGEAALYGSMRTQGGFEGNAHTLRILVRLEKYKQQGWGINPTRRLILAVLKYPVAYSSFDLEKHKKKPPKCYFDEEAGPVNWATGGFGEDDRATLRQLDEKGKPAHRTFDCSVMELADDIAYGVHDIEDIVARKLSDRDHIQQALDAAFSRVVGFQ